MKRMFLLGMATAMVFGLTSAAYASSSHFLVSASIGQSGQPAQKVDPSLGNLGTWDAAYALDDLADGLSVADNGNTLTMDWDIGWISTGSASNQTIYTLNYTVTPELLTDIVGDWASGDITASLQIVGRGISDSDATGTVLVADGLDFTDAITGSLQVATPLHQAAGTTNYGTLRLTVTANAEAFKAEVVIPDPDPDPEPVVPAPGAIFLGSLGAGLVGWLRRNRAL